MVEFLPAVNFVLANEGGFEDRPSDSGGATNRGISLRFLREIPIDRLRKYGLFKPPGDLSGDDIRDLTLEQTHLIYKGEFWDMAPFAAIKDQDLVNYLFDCCVLHGLSQGIKIMQRALWGYWMQKDIVHDDGILGSMSLAEANKTTPRCLIETMAAERAGLMRLIACERPKDKESLDGWLNRCYKI